MVLYEKKDAFIARLPVVVNKTKVLKTNDENKFKRMSSRSVVVRGVGIGHSQIFLTTPTNGMLGMWLIGNSLYDVIRAWSRERDYRPQSKESPLAEKTWRPHQVVR